MRKANIILNWLIILLLVWMIIELIARVNLMPKLTEINLEDHIEEVEKMDNVVELQEKATYWIDNRLKWIKIDEKVRHKYIYISISVLLLFIIK